MFWMVLLTFRSAPHCINVCCGVHQLSRLQHTDGTVTCSFLFMVTWSVVPRSLEAWEHGPEDMRQAKTQYIRRWLVWFKGPHITYISRYLSCSRKSKFSTFVSLHLIERVVYISRTVERTNGELGERGHLRTHPESLQVSESNTVWTIQWFSKSTTAAAGILSTAFISARINQEKLLPGSFKLDFLQQRNQFIILGYGCELSLPSISRILCLIW